MGYCGVTVGYCGVTVGYGVVAVGYCEFVVNGEVAVG